MSDPLSQIVQRERRERERDRTRRKIAFPDLSVKIYKDCTENTTCECNTAAVGPAARAGICAVQQNSSL